MDFQERMADICSLSLFFSTLSYQLLLYCWTINQWTNPSFRDESAVGVIAFMCLLAAFLLLVQLTIGDLQKSKIAAVLSSVLHFVAAIFILVQVIIYGKRAADNRLGNQDLLTAGESYGFVCYITTMVLSIVAGVMLVLETFKS